MFVTPNMGLTAWDQGDDPYDHTQLASNFTAVDAHDHSPSKGVPIPSAGLANGAVTTSKIAVGAVDPATHISAGSIPQSRLAPDAVGESQIAADSVGSSELKPGSVGFAELKDGEATFIGQTALWYRADSAVLPPTGWEVCDGRAWSSITNAMGAGGVQWNTGNIPDTRGKYILGAALAGTGVLPSEPPDIGAVVGANIKDLQHSHTTPPHAHVILSSGTHTHSMTSASRGNNNVEGWSPGDPGAPYPENFAFQDHVHTVAWGGDHNHTGSTGSSAPSTNSSLSATTDIRPASVGFLVIMRVI